MELEAADGATIPINDDSSTIIGRNLGLGFPPSSDRTVSRRHLSLRPTGGPRVSFHVVGKNPVLVRHGADSGIERIYKSSENGELSVGDKFSLSLKNPSFFVLKRRNGEEEEEEVVEKRRILEAVERREKRTLERRRAKREDEELGFDSDLDLDLSEVDPVKEFGFLVKGHEFDHYPKGMIVDSKHWNWFLEEPRKNTDDGGSDDEDEATRSTRRKKGRRAKKKDDGGDEDEEWTGESEEDQVAVVKGGSTKRPKYSTRSKDPKKPRKDVKPRKDKDDEDEDEDEDEEDETLGGFIVEEEEDEEQEAEEEESEEELEEEDEDEEDE